MNLIESMEFTIYRELVSGYLDYRFRFPEKVHQIAERVKKRRGLEIAQYKNRRDLRAIVPLFKDMYNAALGGTEGNVPLTDEEVKSLANQMVWFADPQLIKIIMKDDLPVGFMFAHPDGTRAVQRIKGRIFPIGWMYLLIEMQRTKLININGAGMVEGYRGLGGTALLFSEMYKTVADSRYRFADVVQIGIENENMQREMNRMGIEFHKTHRLYLKELLLADSSLESRGLRY